MAALSDRIITFFQNQGCVLVNTIDENGTPHSSCKGIVEITKNGRVYLFDLYRQRTHNNLRLNPKINITAFDEHKFIGFSLKGTAKAVTAAEIDGNLLKAWEERITGRLTQRLLKNIHEEKGHPVHPEALLPKPQYLIAMDVEEIVDLTPQHINRRG